MAISVVVHGAGLRRHNSHPASFFHKQMLLATYQAHLLIPEAGWCSVDIAVNKRNGLHVEIASAVVTTQKL
jgi:hypothetical protein